MKTKLAVSLLALCATYVGAQTAPAPATSPLDLNLPQAQTPPAPAAGGANEPGKYYGDVDGHASDTQVSGSFTTGIGYAKGWGHSTMNAASLDVNKQTDDGKSFSMRINVTQFNGPGPIGPGPIR
jgi:hypothetical protein